MLRVGMNADKDSARTRPKVPQEPLAYPGDISWGAICNYFSWVHHIFYCFVLLLRFLPQPKATTAADLASLDNGNLSLVAG